MATLNIVSNFELLAQGLLLTGKQGLSTSGPSEPFQVTVSGLAHRVVGSLATASVVTVFDDDDDVPADWDFMHLWADQDLYVQVIGSGSNAIFKVLAKVPFTLTYDSLLAAANTTPITGGAEPSLTDIDSIVLGNYTGSTANYVAAFVD